MRESPDQILSKLTFSQILRLADIEISRQCATNLGETAVHDRFVARAAGYLLGALEVHFTDTEVKAILAAAAIQRLPA